MGTKLTRYGDILITGMGEAGHLNFIRTMKTESKTELAARKELEALLPNKAERLQLADEWSELIREWSDPELDRDLLIEQLDDELLSYLDRFGDFLEPLGFSPFQSPRAIDASTIPSDGAARDLIDLWVSIRFDLLRLIGERLAVDSEFGEFALNLQRKLSFTNQELDDWVLPKPELFTSEREFINAVKALNAASQDSYLDTVTGTNASQILAEDPLELVRATRLNLDWVSDFEGAFSKLTEVYRRTNELLEELLGAEDLTLLKKRPPYRSSKPPEVTEEFYSNYHAWRVLRREAIEDMLGAAKRGEMDSAVEMAEALEFKRSEVSLLEDSKRMRVLKAVFETIPD